MSHQGLGIRRTILFSCVAILVGCSNSGSSPSADTSSPVDGTDNLVPVVQQVTSQGVTQIVEQPAAISPVVTPVVMPVVTPVVVPKVVVNGVVTFDRVPFSKASYGGLDYSATYIAPARGVTVQALNSQGGVIVSSQTNELGEYSFTVEENVEIQVRVVAELIGTQTAAWDIQVRDNTSGGAVYVLEGALASVGNNSSQARDLHAQSGWTGSSYSEYRSAAPFAILDSIRDAVVKIVDADESIVLPPLSVYWSTNNIAMSGSFREGNIGTSFYTSSGPSIYLLGAENNDSDEFDRGVIQHEFGHYIEHQVSRSESVGGSHNQNSKLDMRVAFGEAWGNAFSAMVSDDPLYRDSLGANQSLGFTVDVEAKPWTAQGWFNEATIQALLYDLYDAESDDDDNIALGFKALHQVFTDDQYVGFDGFASIYSFVHLLKLKNPNQADQITALVESYDIFGSGWWGEGETNDGGFAIILPIYNELNLSGSTEVCSDKSVQEFNGVENRRYMKVNITESNSYVFSALRSGGTLSRTNPQLRLFKQGTEIVSGTRSTNNYEQLDLYLESGVYILEVFEQSNIDNSESTGGLACFDVAVE